MLVLLPILSFISLGVSCSSKDEVLIYSAAEDDRIAFIQSKLDEAFPQYNIVIQYTGTGSLYTKLLGEGTKTDCDIFYDFEANNAMTLYNNTTNLYADLSSDYNNNIYLDTLDPQKETTGKFAFDGKTYGAILVNKKVLAEKSLAIPATFDDLLNTSYKGLIEMPNPKSSGTGFSFYSGLVGEEGKEAALSYFTSLSKNIAQFTSSGAAPTRDVDRGDVAIGFGMLWECVKYANNNSDLEVIYLDKGLPYNLYTMGMINGHEEKEGVKEVFDYLYNDLNKLEVCKFNPAKIYKDQGSSEITNYPETVEEMTMTGIFDSSYKQDLLDSWTL